MDDGEKRRVAPPNPTGPDRFRDKLSDEAMKFLDALEPDTEDEGLSELVLLHPRRQPRAKGR